MGLKCLPWLRVFSVHRTGSIVCRLSVTSGTDKVIWFYQNLSTDSSCTTIILPSQNPSWLRFCPSSHPVLIYVSKCQLSLSTCSFTYISSVLIFVYYSKVTAYLFPVLSIESLSFLCWLIAYKMDRPLILHV